VEGITAENDRKVFFLACVCTLRTKIYRKIERGRGIGGRLAQNSGEEKREMQEEVHIPTFLIITDTFFDRFNSIRR